MGCLGTTRTRNPVWRHRRGLLRVRRTTPVCSKPTNATYAATTTAVIASLPILEGPDERREPNHDNRDCDQSHEPPHDRL